MDLIAILLAVAVVISMSVYIVQQKRAHRERLEYLLAGEIGGLDAVDDNEINWAQSAKSLSLFTDRLGRAGFTTLGERRRIKLIGSIVAGCVLVASVWYGSRHGLAEGVLGAVFGAYASLLAWLYYLRFRANDLRRAIIFQVPLVVEALILLVESGLGILPAIERIVSAQDVADKENPVIRMFRLVYQLSSHGMPFSQALEVVANTSDVQVLRHVLLHLDISGSEGGELIPSLRSLSEHAHTEWRLSVEHRVKRLENSVVFPVFAAVIGLMLLTASVPMVPILEFKENLKTPNSSVHDVMEVTK